MNLVVRNRVINAPIHKILTTLRSELNNGKLRDIHDEYQDNIAITCPKHKDGFERRASCQVYCRRDNDDVEYGKCHCFTCGYTASLPQLITFCFEEQEGFGEEWLVERFGIDYDENHLYLPEYARLSTGMRIGQWDLGYDDFKNLPFIIPPREEQDEIVEFIESGLSKFDNLIAKKTALLAEMESYKKSVIYEYVTGKKEVAYE